PLRLLVLAAHALAATFLALLARRYGASAGGSLAAALLYVGSCGFSSMWIWFPSGSSVVFALAALTGGAAALAWRTRLGVLPACLLAGAALLAALLTESTLAPLTALLVAVDELERRRAGARRWSVGPFALVAAATALGVAVLVATLYARTFGPRVSVSLRHGVPRAAFLLLAAPFRLFFPGIPVRASEPGLSTAVLGTLLGLAVGAAVAALLLALWRRGAPRLAGVAALAAIGPLGWLALVGLGRWRSSYWELYEGDRYFFPLLVPLALLAAAVATTLGERAAAWPRRTRAALCGLLLVAGGAELLLHRRAMLGRIPFDIYQAHERRFAQLALLVDRLEAAARGLPAGDPPLRFPDADLWFPDVHNGRVSARVLLHVLADGAGGRLRLGGQRVSARDERLLEPLLEGWARAVGEPLPYLSIEDGRLADAHVQRMVDFRTGPQDGAVVSGFYHWEGSSRWLQKRGTLRLTLTSPSLVLLLAAPIEELRRADPRLSEINVAVTAVDEAIGWATPLGTLRVASGGLQGYRLDATPFLSRLGNGRVVHLVLEADRTWRPADKLPGLTDTRELSVMVFAIGCE
ncbi:MAG TPA: hypothetical protein VGC93_13335, partial [Thermoanaerobaculia bacterium]